MYILKYIFFEKIDLLGAKKYLKCLQLPSLEAKLPVWCLFRHWKFPKMLRSGGEGTIEFSNFAKFGWEKKNSFFSDTSVRNCQICDARVPKEGFFAFFRQTRESSAYLSRIVHTRVPKQGKSVLPRGKKAVPCPNTLILWAYGCFRVGFVTLVSHSKV